MLIFAWEGEAKIYWQFMLGDETVERSAHVKVNMTGRAMNRKFN